MAARKLAKKLGVNTFVTPKVGEAYITEIVRGKHVARGTRLLIIPASSEVMLEALKRGYVETLMEAGAVFSTPGCGPC